MEYIEKINAELRRYIPLVSKLPGGENVLRRAAVLMDAAGNPQDKLRVIHIAGTSGKTSTAYFTSALLVKTGCKVGLTVSPHVDEVTERVQINNQPLPPSEFYELLSRFLKIIKRVDVQPSYFELLYAFSVWVFAMKGVDYAVVETGVGGLYDASNIARKEDKLCVITDIGFDHMALLGNTIEAIAAQKAGIIHRSNPVITFRQSEAILNVIRRQVKQEAGKLIVVKPMPDHEELFSSSMPLFQRHNWWIAFCAYDYLRQRDGLSKLNPEDLGVTQKTYVPCRMETIKTASKTIIMDGAHNPQKIQSLVDSFKALYPSQKADFLIALKEDKDMALIGRAIRPVAGSVVVTKFKSSEDLPAKSWDLQPIVDSFEHSGIAHVEAVEQQELAFPNALDKSEDILIICGSFYLLSQLRTDYPWLRHEYPSKLNFTVLS